MRYFWILAGFLAWTNTTFANEIYIEQIGDNLDLDITQDGQNNSAGDSNADMTLEGDDMTFAITQTGDNNAIDAVIKGNTYTGTWVFTGDTNTVDLTCDDTSGVNCENVTLNITTTGDDNLYEIYVGESADADGLAANFTVTGDGNVLQSDIDGESVVVTVVLNNASTTSTTQVTDSGTSNQTGEGGNLINLDISGDGDSAGMEVILDITGGGNNVDITQSGIYDNKVDLDMTGDNGEVTITQSD